MREETIEIDGVMLTLAEAREALAFWDAHCCGAVPECIGEPVYGPSDSGAYEVLWYIGQDHQLTPERIEAIRDFAEPWQEVRRDEVEPGEVFRILAHGSEYLATPCGTDVALSTGCLQSKGSNAEPVLVRRPRKKALTLGQATTEAPMSETIEIDGKRLSAIQCREVLDWIGDPTREAPRFLYLSCAQLVCLRFYPHDPGHGGSEGVQLTHERIEAIRDFAEPWQEVRRDEVEPGEVFRWSRYECTALPRSIEGPSGRFWHSGQRSFQTWLEGSEPVFVRRMRRETLTLGDVADGANVRRLADGATGFACHHYPGEDLRYVLVGPYKATRWRLDTPVELVPEGDHE